MKICFIADNFDIRQRSAAPLAHLHAVTALSHLGHHVTLVLRRPDDLTNQATKLAFLNALKDAGLNETISFASFRPPKFKGRGEILYGLWAALWAKQQRFDLLWTRYLYAADFASWLGIPTIAEHHLFLSKKGRAATHRMLKRPAFKVFVTISESHKRILIKNYDLPEAKLIVGHSAVNAEHFKVKANPAEVKTQLHLPKTPLVVYCGSLYQGRGIEQLFVVARHLPQVTIVCIGGPEPEATRFSQEAQRMGLTNMFYCGPVPQQMVPCYLATADVLILPHTHDARAIDGTLLADVASPLKLFEYMAAGRPIVASALEPVREILEDGRTAMLVPPENTAALIMAIETLLAQPTLAQSLAEAALAEVEKYSWEARGTRILTHIGYD